jgi:hypothetical protein
MTPQQLIQRKYDAAKAHRRAMRTWLIRATVGTIGACRGTIEVGGVVRFFCAGKPRTK